MPSLKEIALQVARERGVARAREFGAHGVHRATLRRLRDEGFLVRTGRGLYQLAGVETSAAHSLAEAVKAMPGGTVCLLSALQFHELTTQTPHEVWLMIGWKRAVPRNPPVSLRLVRATGEVLTAGIELHTIDGVAVPITSPAKTVADCFKHRNKIGLDVALEALREALRGKRTRVDDLWHHAGIDRVQNVMRPYIEAML